VTVRCNLGVKQGAGLPLPLQFAEIVAVFSHLSVHAVVCGAQDNDFLEMARAWWYCSMRS
jgi:hypothetical protein